MQGDPRFFSGEGSPFYPHAVDGYPNTNLIGGNYTYGIPNTVRAFPPLNGIEFEPSEICPKNFIIFDQTDNRGKIMFHPTLAHKFGCPDIDSRAASIRDVGKSTEKCNEDEAGFSSSFKEDTEEINALLSSDDDGEEDESDDVVSTARTLGKWGDSSPDSYFSTGSSDSSEMKFTSQNSFSSGGSQSERKRERMRKMVNTLRGIIPGGESMDTTVILDEAVKYLKSLKVEAKKLGIRNLKD